MAGIRSLPLLLFASVACSQIIGLGDLEKTEDDDNGDMTDAGDGHSGSSNQGGAPPLGGRSQNGGVSPGGASDQPGGTSAEDGGAPPMGGSGAVAGGGGTPEGTGGLPPTSGAGGASDAGVGGTPNTSDGGVGGRHSNAGAGGGGAGGTTGCVRQELLVDPNFDIGSSAWKEQSTDGSAVILSTPFLLTSPYAAWLGHYEAEDEDTSYVTEAYQIVTVPPGTVELEGHCQCRLRTAELPSDVFDEAYLLLSDPSTPTLDPITTLSSVDNQTRAGQWFYFGGTLGASEIQSLGLAGAEIAFDLYALNDFSAITDFFVDNCSLLATVCE